MPSGLREMSFQEIVERYTDGTQSLDPGAVQTCSAFMRVVRDTYALFERHFAHLGLSPGRLRLLLQLADGSGGEVSPCDLAERVGISRATVTGLLDGLEKGGLLARVAHPGDRRRMTARITPAGEALLRDVLPEHFRRMTALFADLSEAERQTLVSLLAKIDSRAKATR